MERIDDVLMAGRWQVWDSDIGLTLMFSEIRRGKRVECEVSGILKTTAILKVISIPEHVSFSLVWSPTRCTMAYVKGSSHLSS